ncbi:MAG TPA: GTP-binding protein [Stellaceae bacterium]|jgi:G3E family GTPase|nr:GTP-binding protein [Stellaceae bacterium]
MAGFRADDGGPGGVARTRSLTRQGLVAVKECRWPVVVHFVQHVAHPPVELEDWPDDDRRSRLVFVTRSLPREPVAQLFASVAAVAAPACG